MGYFCPDYIKVSMKRINVALAFMLLSFGSMSVYAQTTQASILGRVTSQSNAPQTKATVKILNESTGFSTETVTNSNGEYIFKEIPLGGPYRVFVNGHERKEGYNVNFGDQLTVNINLADSDEKISKKLLLPGI